MWVHGGNLWVFGGLLVGLIDYESLNLNMNECVSHVFNEFMTYIIEKYQVVQRYKTTLFVFLLV
jgi:hypothetical protein